MLKILKFIHRMAEKFLELEMNSFVKALISMVILPVLLYIGLNTLFFITHCINFLADNILFPNEDFAGRVNVEIGCNIAVWFTLFLTLLFETVKDEERCMKESWKEWRKSHEKT